MKWYNSLFLFLVFCLTSSYNNDISARKAYKDFTTESFYNYYTGQLHAAIRSEKKHYYYVVAPKFCSSCFGYYADVLMKHCSSDSVTIISGHKNISYLRNSYPAIKADWVVVADEALLDKQYFTRSMQAFGYAEHGKIMQFEIINKGSIDHYPARSIAKR